MEDELAYVFYASVDSEPDSPVAQQSPLSNMCIVRNKNDVPGANVTPEQEESVPEDPSLPDGDYFSVKLEKAAAPHFIGIVMETRADGLLAVSAVKPDSPAAKCQAIATGDLIISINKTWTLRLPKRTVVSLVRAAPVGSKIAIRLCRLRDPGASSSRKASGGVPQRVAVRQCSSARKCFPAITEQERQKFYDDIENAILSGNPDALITTISRHFEHSAELMRQAPCHPLHLAISKGLDDVVIFLVGQNVIDVNSFSDKFNATPLCLAARHNFFTFVEILIDSGAEDTSSISDPNNCALHVAIQIGSSDIAKVLAAHHPELRDGDNSEAEHYLLYLAVLYGRADLLRFWWDSFTGIDPNAPVTYQNPDTHERILLAVAFHCSSVCSKGRLGEYRDIIQFLILKGAIINKQVAQSAGCAKAILKYLNGKKEIKEPKVSWPKKSIGFINFDQWLKPSYDRIIELNLSVNPLTELPSQLPWSLGALESFVLCRCEHLPALSNPSDKNAIHCTRLKKVVISDNKTLSSIPLAWFQIPNLVTMNLSNNNIKELPDTPTDDERWTCIHLELFNVSNNQLKILPKAMAGTRSLKQLLAADNSLEQLPNPWGCPLLKLDLSRNRLSCLPDGMRRNWARSLQHLDVSNNRLTSIPVDVCGLKRLAFLNLSNNELKYLPPPEPEYWLCKRLQTFNLSHNDLGCSFVRQKSLSSGSSSGLTWWQKLSTNQNSLPTAEERRSFSPPNSDGANFPPELSGPDWSFPTVFAESIQSINLSKNNMPCVPINISRLSSLNELDISHNPEIHDIPPELGRLKNLDIIHLIGLDLRQLPNHLNPKKIGFVRTADLLRFLRSKLRGEESYRHMKLIVLGHEGCGKTTLISNLCGREDVHHKRESAVWRWNWPLEPPSNATKREKRNKKVKCSVWELTGPDSFFPVHQCFMTDRALYILVIRLDTRSWDIGPWLLTIKARAPKSSVIIVGTRRDSLEALVDNVNTEIKRLERALTECADAILGCPRILRFFTVSNDSVMSEMSQLRACIYHYCDTVVSKQKVPRSYIKIHEAVEYERIMREQANQLPVLTESELWHLVQQTAENDIEMGDEEELAKVLKQLDQSGVLLHYRHAMKTVDEPWYYLNPTWLGCQMLKLTLSQTAKRKMSINEAEQILSGSTSSWLNPPSLDFTHLLELMQRYELLVLLDETKLLVPSKLPFEGPEMEIHFSGPSVCRLYRMSCTPPGFWSRLIARLHLRYSKSPKSRSKSGSKTSDSGNQLIRQRASTLVRANSIGGSFEPRTIGRMVEQVFYWAEGMFVRAGQGYLTVQSLRQSNINAFIPKTSEDRHSVEGVVIYWQWQDDVEPSDLPDELYFGVGVDEVDLIISEWFPDVDFGEERVQRYAVCPVCLQSALSPTCEEPQEQISCFPLEALAAAALQTETIQCPFHDDSDMQLRSLIPDVMLWDIPYLMHFDQKCNDVQFENFLAKGGQGSIFRGKFCDKDIAAKVFYSDNSMLSDVGGTGRRTLVRQQSVLSQVTLATIYDSTATRTTAHQTEHELPVLLAFQRMRREVVFLSSMDHPCIISILGAMVCPSRPICFALDFAKHGNMARFVAESGQKLRKNEDAFFHGGHFGMDGTGLYHGCLIDRTLLYKFAWETAVALEYLHSKGVLYRDLKSENILVWSTDPEAVVNIKMSDYGISCYSAPQGNVGTEGTRGYQAPEVLKNMAYDDKADMFSYGMVLYELLTGKIPYFDMTFPEDINRAVKLGKRPSVKDSGINPDFRAIVQLMEQCWSAHPAERPAAAGVRDKMQTISFFALRQQMLVDADSARQYGFSIRSGRRKSSVSSIPEEELDFSTNTKLLMAYPANIENCCLITGNREKRMGIIDCGKGRFIEKEIPLPEAQPIAVCCFSDLILILSGGPEPYVDIFQCVHDQTMPDSIGSCKLGILKDKEITAFCVFSEGERRSRMYIGLQSSEIAVFKSNDSKCKEWELDTYFNLDFLTEEIAFVANFARDQNLLVASGTWVFILQQFDMTLLSQIRVFEQHNVDFICTSDNMSIWCASKTSLRLVRLKQQQIVKQVNLCQYGVGIQTQFPAFLSPDSAFVTQMSHPEEGVTAMVLVDNCLWVAVEDQILILDKREGRRIAKLALPVDEDYGECQVDAMQVVADSVVCLVTYSSPNFFLDSRKSSAVTITPDSSAASFKTSDPSLRLCASVQKILIWQALDATQIRQLERTWQNMVELEATKRIRKKY